jgi:hypothetical protein
LYECRGVSCKVGCTKTAITVSRNSNPENGLHYPSAVVEDDLFPNNDYLFNILKVWQQLQRQMRNKEEE